MNLVALFQPRTASEQTQMALTAFRQHRVAHATFQDLEAGSAAIAAEFLRAGLQRGDAVLVFYPMSVELYAVLLALIRLGLIAVFIDPSAGKEHIERCCELYPPQALLASPKAHLLRLVSPALRRIPLKFSLGAGVPGAKTLRWQAASAQGENYEGTAREVVPNLADVPASHPALLTFTSGSTGQPKAALRTHGFLQAQHRVLQQRLALAPGETDLATLPIFVLANLASGVQSVIPGVDLRFPGAIDPRLVVEQIQATSPVRTAASPALLERLADYCLAQKIQLNSFQKIFTGGAPVFPRLLDKLQTIAPQARVVAVYGSTEAEPIAEIARDEITSADWQAMRDGRGLLAGTPVPEIHLRIVREQWGVPVPPLSPAEFARRCLPVNEPGEIVVSGEHVLPGYLHGQGDEETKFLVDGQVWHRTGDAGYLDHAGRLWLLGRCSAKITDAHGTLYPFAVECAAMNFAVVRRAALVSLQGQRVLVVELLEGENALPPQFQEALVWAKLGAVRMVKRIPVDQRHNAKVDYPALHKMLKLR